MLILLLVLFISLANCIFNVQKIKEPMMEIISPTNGQMLEDSTLFVALRITNFILPYTGRKVCIGLSTKEGSSNEKREHCIDSLRGPHKISNLQAGKHYTLRCQLLENGKTVKQSLRFFHVPSILLSGGKTSTLSGSMEVAMKYHSEGDISAAVKIYKKVLDINYEHADANHLLGIVLMQSKIYEEAIEHIQRAIETNKINWNYKNTLGETYRTIGHYDEALKAFKEASALNPSNLDIKYNIGLCLMDDGQNDKALTVFNEVANPILVKNLGQVSLDAQFRLCSLYRSTKLYNNATECIINGVKKFPNAGELYNEGGLLYLTLGDTDTASVYFTNSMKLGHVEGNINLGIVCELQGDTESALIYFNKALADLAKNPNGMLSEMSAVKIKIATLLPRIMPSTEKEITKTRTIFSQQIINLISQQPKVNRPLSMGFTLGFYLAYHGQNDVQLKSQLAELYRIALKDSSITDIDDFTEEDQCSFFVRRSAAPSSLLGTADNKITVAFISRFFTAHSIGRLMQGVISQLDKNKFKIVIFMITGNSMEESADTILGRIIEAADYVVHLPNDIKASHQLIMSHHPHMIIYPEIGMDPFAYFLALSRLAPIQAVWLGHPETTGIATIDYFISSDVEVTNADQNYSETLYKLKGFGTYYYKPPPPPSIQSSTFPPLRVEIGVDSNALLYLCPQSLFKFHPSFDLAIKKILEQDNEAHLILLKGRTKKWTDRLVLRLESLIGKKDFERVHFISRRPHEDLLQLMKSSDIMLDTFPFGGGVTSMEAFSLGLPVITFPSELLSGRLTLAMYRIMDIMNPPVTHSIDEYVTVALKLGRDSKERKNLSQEILASSYHLFNQKSAIREWEEMITSITNKRLSKICKGIMEKRREFVIPAIL